MIERLRDIGLVEGKWVIVRHSEPLYKELAQIPGVVETIKPHETMLSWLIGVRSADVIIRTGDNGNGGTITIKRVTPDKIDSVIDPCTLNGSSRMERAGHQICRNGIRNSKNIFLLKEKYR